MNNVDALTGYFLFSFFSSLSPEPIMYIADKRICEINLKNYWIENHTDNNVIYFLLFARRSSCVVTQKMFWYMENVIFNPYKDRTHIQFSVFVSKQARNKKTHK